MITRFLWQGMGRNLRLFVLLVLAIGIVLPLLNQLMPATSALYVPAWALQLIGKYLCFASLALAVDLVWGFCGILTLGIANKFLEPVAGAVLGKIAILVLIILFIQKRPRGLFALKGRAVEA